MYHRRIIRFSFTRCRGPHDPARYKFLWQGLCPDRDVVEMPVCPLHADAVHRVPDPVDMADNCFWYEIKRDPRIRHGFTLCHPVPASATRAHDLYPGLFLQDDRMPVPGISVFRSTSRLGENGRSSSLTRAASCRIPSVPFCFLYVDSMLTLPLLSARARENFS